MTEEVLNRADIDTGFQEVGGKPVWDTQRKQRPRGASGQGNRKKWVSDFSHTDRKGNTITMNLVKVPLFEAVRALCEVRGARLRVEAFAVVIDDDAYGSTELFTKVFRVPRDFLNLATIPAAPGDALPPKPTAMDVLTQAGIAFPEGRPGPAHTSAPVLQ